MHCVFSPQKNHLKNIFILENKFTWEHPILSLDEFALLFVLDILKIEGKTTSD